MSETGDARAAGRALPADLARLLERVAGDLDGPEQAEPPFEHPAGEPPADWMRRVATVRAQHDAFAQRRRGVLAAAARELFGTDAAGLLGDPGPLSREDVELPVASDGVLLRLAPGLERPMPRSWQTPAPARPLPVRVTSPESPRAAIVRLHGGAFWMGGGVTRTVIDRVLVDLLASRCNAMVLDVDYRLAPEHPYPAAVLDTLHALDRVRADVAARGIDPSRIALVGTSSGANVATTAAMLDAARGDVVPLAALALVVPSVDATSAAPALRDDPVAWEKRRRLVRGYLGTQVDPSDPRVSPALRAQLPGMPPTFAAIAEFDEVAVGGEALCRAIRAGGGVAESRVYPMTHTTATPAVEASVMRDLADFLRPLLGASRPLP
ncbi:alpha/beta hydrolase fold domain-containing protein [Pseudolysinimonas sp.]|uniref:alpha/beta hydrolase fold domain-containing protein n=1 Tax=Pseudolysinimonas sp. TaxID=2680009 RepID=UPI003783BD49